MTLAYVGLGSNLEEPRAQVDRAFDQLARLPRTRLARRSSLYRSAPLGPAAQPDFINAVAALDTELAAEELLRELQAIESRHGRKRSFANAPRTLDLDLLLYGDARIRSPQLVVPHPRMHERAFVLQPLLEIAPLAFIPGRGPATGLPRRCGRAEDRKDRLMQIPTVALCALMLAASNVFMTFAWYAHLKDLYARPWWIAALVSWGIALFEYLLQVPANRIGYAQLSLGQLKIMQEAITLTIFVPFSVLYMNQPVKLDYLWASLCMVGAVYFIFRG